MSMIRMKPSCLIFDLFGVVISFDDSIVYKRIAHYCAAPDQAFQALDDLVSRHDLITARITLQEIYHQIVEDHGLTLSYDAFHALWQKPYTQPMRGMGEILEALRSSYQLVLLSNVDAVYWATVPMRHPEINCFDKALVSCELGIAKPDHEIFAHAAKVADVTPTNCFFVDDKKENTEAASALGFSTHLFDGSRNLRKALGELGIKL